MIARTVADGEAARVLVVDDDPANRYLLCQWLRRAGHDVLDASDGAEALALLSAEGDALPELALLDVNLPDMTGFELCQSIKAAASTADMPVVHVSATAITVADRTQGLHGGADAYLVEPVDKDELLATVTAVLRYTRARRAAQRLAKRLIRLNNATFELHRATTFEQFADAAVNGTIDVFGAESASVYLSLSGQPVRTYQTDRNAPLVAEPVRPDQLERVARFVLGSRTGAGAVYVSQKDFRAVMPGPAVPGAVHIAAVQALSTRPPVCVAIATEEAPTEDDRTLLIQMAQACALSLESLRNLAEEHEIALELQRSFLPRELPAAARARLAVRYVPARANSEIGGDFYEAIETDAGLLLAIGDVVGHSLDAAIVMGQVRHALRAYAFEGHPPDRILELLDSMLSREGEVITATLCLALVDADRRRLHIANAGHIPPLLLTGNESRFLHEHGRLIGLGGARYSVTSIDLPGPCRLVLCTDGLVEERRVPLDASLEAFAAAARSGPEDLDALCDGLLETFGQAKEDDIALLAADLG